MSILIYFEKTKTKTETTTKKITPSQFKFRFKSIVDMLHYYMAESVFAMRLVNLRSVTCYTDQNF